jgi:uncharacterized membrane protein (GlpM family)
MKEILIRFFIGGLLVSLFALLGDVFKPKSFAGLFGAAPSVALATIAITISKSGAAYTSIEAKSMMVSAVGFFVYTCFVSWIMSRQPAGAKSVTLGALGLWAAVTFGLWTALLK